MKTNDKVKKGEGVVAQSPWCWDSALLLDMFMCVFARQSSPLMSRAADSQQQRVCATTSTAKSREQSENVYENKGSAQKSTAPDPS